MTKKNELPVLSCEVTALTIKDNLPVFKVAANEFLSNIIIDLETSADFYTAKSDVKKLSEFERTLTALKTEVLKKADKVHTIISTIDDFIEQSKKKRTPLNRKVDAENERIKNEVLELNVKEVNDYIEAANNSIAPATLAHQHTAIDFAGAGKGTKTLDTYTNAVKKRTKEIIGHLKTRMSMLSANIATYEEEFKESYDFLFTDLNVLLDNTPENFHIACSGRVSTYKLKQAEIELAEKAKQAEVQSESIGANAIDALIEEQTELKPEQVEDINQENAVSGEPQIQQKPRPVPPGFKPRPVPPGRESATPYTKPNPLNSPEDTDSDKGLPQNVKHVSPDFNDDEDKFLVESIFKMDRMRTKFIDRLLLKHRVEALNVNYKITDNLHINHRVIEGEGYYAVIYKD